MLCFDKHFFSMKGYSKAIIIGTVGKEPLIRYIQKGFSKITFPVAVDETVISALGQEIVETQWHNIVTYGELSKFAEKYVHKGDIIFLEGKLQNRFEYTEEGFRFKTTDILASRLEIISRSKSGQDTPLPDDSKEEKTGSAIPGFDIDNLKLEVTKDDLPF